MPNTDRREPVLSCQPRKRGRPRGSQARRRILQHAEQAFATRGYHGCTVEDILSASGVSRRTFYRHFANRDEVFRGLFVEKTDALATLVERFRQAPASAQDAYLRLGALFEHYLDAMFAVGDLLPVLVREAMSEPEYATIRERMLAQFRETIRTILGPFAHAHVNDLLIEGCLAGIERIVLVESEACATPDQKRQMIRDTCLHFVPVLFDTSAISDPETIREGAN